MKLYKKYCYKLTYSSRVIHEIVSSFGVDAGSLRTDLWLANDDVTEVALKPRPSPAWRKHAQRKNWKQQTFTDVGQSDATYA